jgi:hypothetical protein
MWKGDNTNRPPNNIQEPIERSEKIIADNRASQVRRDTDTNQDYTITLYDIDETILTHLEQLQLQVTDVGKKVKVPIFFGSPEKWVAAQRDGYIRDKQGKIILPAIIFKRTNSESDDTLKFFNRYLNASFLQSYSEKNKYTRFNTLIGKNAPVNEVYNIVIPSHVVLTYKFIIWTELVEQMNGLVESFQFNTKDYWGSKKGFKFRTQVNGGYGHTTELQASEDRIVKTEFDLTTHGYILPDTMTKLDQHKLTVEKMFTPKKIVMGMEIVSSDTDFLTINDNSDKWKNPNYPNLKSNEIIPTAPVSFSDSGDISDISSKITNTLTNITNNISTNTETITVGVDDTSPYLKVVPPPTDFTSEVGREGQVSYDKSYFYIFSSGKWRKVAISQFS